jgi:hypothetical protein
MKLWMIAAVILCACWATYAEDPVELDDGPQVNRSIESEGYHRAPFNVMVGTITAVSLYAAAGLENYENLQRAHRATLIVNPSANFQLWVATWAGFADNDPTAFYVPEASGTYRDNVHQNLYFRYQTGASSGPVRGVVTYN